MQLILIRRSCGPVYSFDRSWGLPGGVLYGENFFTDICMLGYVQHALVAIAHVDGVWVISSSNTDPDFLLYLWKKAKGHNFKQYISGAEVIFLHGFYRRNGFDMMLSDILQASKELATQKKGCIIQ